jgi:hypothetical protein
MRTLPGWLCAISLLTCFGCAPEGPSTPPNPSSFGRFEGDVIAVWDTDGRNMTLRDNFAYVDARGRRWEAPANSIINGASIPQGFWTFIGGPFEGRYRNASVVHDVECHQMRQPWEDVHQMFYEACLCGGVDETQAKMMYYAVYHFGPRWETVTETQMQMQPAANGQLVEQPVTVHRVMRVDPLPPTPDEIDHVAEFVTEDKPTTAVLQATTRTALQRRPRRHRGSYHRSPQGTADYREPFAQSPDQRERPPATPQEQAWAQEIIGDYLTQQAGQPVPAQCFVHPTSRGYRVFVQYLQYDEQGQASTYPGGHAIIRLSREGQIMGVTNGGEDRQRY